MRKIIITKENLNVAINDTAEEINIITDDRIFTKLINNKEVDIDVKDIKVGDKFKLYSDKEKKVGCHWDDAYLFECSGPVFKNEDDVSFIQCSTIIENKKGNE